MKILFTLIVSCISLWGGAQSSLELLGHYTFPSNIKCSSLTGYADTLGNEYALVGTTTGLYIINITDPANPILTDTVPGRAISGITAREVRTYKSYAYVTSEQGDSMTVVNLSQLPNGTITYHKIFPDSSLTSHTIFIDEHGIAYVNGTNRGQLMLDLNINPWNPHMIGKYTNEYVHDCFVRNDTMWAACLGVGEVRVIDVRNKSAVNDPSNLIASWETPSRFTHNVWLSDDSKYLFTTDERTPSYLTCYDVTELDNVVETDRILLQGDSTAIMHNTHYKDGYCYTADYTYGVTMHNVSNKYNLIEEGHYDTSPFTGTAFKGAWEAWPYLPSGNIIVSDIETGLWIFKPNPNQPCYITGTITDNYCGTTLYNATISIEQTPVTAYSDLLGKYNTYTYDTGAVNITVSKPGFNPKIIQNVQLNADTTLNIDVALVPTNPQGKVTILCKDIDTHDPISNALLEYYSTSTIGSLINYESTNHNGVHSRCDLPFGNYFIYAGKWGYILDSAHFITNVADTLVFLLKKGYYDDFAMNYHWSYSAGIPTGWVRTKPYNLFYGNFPDPYSPQDDMPDDVGVYCYITGRSVNSNLNNTISTPLTSPLTDLTNYSDPYISYYRWYINGYENDPNDPFKVYIRNGQTMALIDSVPAGTITPGWVYKSIRIKDYITLTDSMRIVFSAIDALPDNITMAAVDKVQITDFGISGIVKETNTNNISVYPNPFTDDVMLLLTEAMQDVEEVYIYNTSGAFITKIQIPANVQQLKFGSNLSAGVYILKATTTTHSYSTKLVKLK